ncbi:VOC family protein [Lacicoccus alkaliphilus]
MMIKKIDHMVMTVSSIEQTSKFYRDVLGMEVGKIW